MSVCASQTAEVCALPRPALVMKNVIGLEDCLRLRYGAARNDKRRGREQGQADFSINELFPLG
jgi:hypothetical protein